MKKMHHITTVLAILLITGLASCGDALYESVRPNEPPAKTYELAPEEGTMHKDEPWDRRPVRSNPEDTLKSPGEEL